MVKCQCCGQEADWAWQPCGPDESIASFTTLGSHYRGFLVVKVCDDCKGRVERGERVRFTYRGGEYQLNNGAIGHVKE